MGLNYYQSRIVLAANEWGANVTVDATTKAVYLPAGTYYLDSSTAAESLTQAMEDALEDAVTGFAGEGFTIDFVKATGHTTIRCSTVSASDFDWVWLSDAYRDAMGFTAGFTNVGTTTQTSTNIAQFVLYAGSGRTSYRREFHNDNRYRMASSGRSASVGNTTELRAWSWSHNFEPLTATTSPVLASGTMDEDSSVLPWTWEDFFLYHKSTGQPFRMWEDPSDSLADYSYGHDIELNEKSRGPFTPQPTEDNSDRYFTVQMAVNKYAGT